MRPEIVGVPSAALSGNASNLADWQFEHRPARHTSTDRASTNMPLSTTEPPYYKRQIGRPIRASPPPAAISIPGFPARSSKAILLCRTQLRKARFTEPRDTAASRALAEIVDSQLSCGNQKHYREVREAAKAAENRLLRPHHLPPNPPGRVCACQLDRSSTTANLTDLSGSCQAAAGHKRQKFSGFWSTEWDSMALAVQEWSTELPTEPVASITGVQFKPHLRYSRQIFCNRTRPTGRFCRIC